MATIEYILTKIFKISLIAISLVSFILGTSIFTAYAQSANGNANGGTGGSGTTVYCTAPGACPNTFGPSTGGNANGGQGTGGTVTGGGTVGNGQNSSSVLGQQPITSPNFLPTAQITNVLYQYYYSGGPWIALTVYISVQNMQGRMGEVAAYFLQPWGSPLFAPLNSPYRDVYGHVTAAVNFIPNSQYSMIRATIYIPYYAIGLFSPASLEYKIIVWDGTGMGARELSVSVPYTLNI